MRKIILISLLCAFIGASAGALTSGAIQNAMAQVGVSVVSAPALEAIESASLAKTIIQWVKEELLKTLRDIVVKRIVDDLTDQIIDAIENGGSPLFIQDPLGALQREGDIAFDTFNSYLGSETGVNLCAPFNAQLSLYFQTTFQKEQKFGIPPRCTFEGFQQALQDSAHLIEKGGWITFQQAFVPSNNFFGASLLVDQAYMSEVAQKTKQASDSLNRNAGFTDVSKCTAWENPLTGARISENEARDIATNRCTSGPAGGGGAGGAIGGECVANVMEGMCVRKETLTPGSVVAQAATKGILKDFEYAANVQSVISALVNSVLSKVFKPADQGGRGLIDASSSVRGRSLDYGSYTGLSFADRVQKAKNDLLAFQRAYYETENYLERMVGLISFGKTMAYQDIYNCYPPLGRYPSSPESRVGAPYFGYAYYQPQEGFSITVPLIDLIDYPLKPEDWTAIPSLPRGDIGIKEKVVGAGFKFFTPGGPFSGQDMEDIAKNDIKSNAYVFTTQEVIKADGDYGAYGEDGNWQGVSLVWGRVDPDIENRENGLPHDVNDPDFPDHEGYFTRIGKMVDAAYIAIVGRDGDLANPGLKERINDSIISLSQIKTKDEDIKKEILATLLANGTASTSDIALEIFNNSSSTLITDYIASSTDFMGRVVALETKTFQEFSNLYADAVSEVTDRALLGGGPGGYNLSGGLSSTLRALVKALLQPMYQDDDLEDPNYVWGGEHVGQMHTCGEPRDARGF